MEPTVTLLQPAARRPGWRLAVAVAVALGALVPGLARADVNALRRATLLPGPSGTLANGQTVTYQVDYSNPPQDTTSTGNVPPILISASFFPNPATPAAVGFTIVDPLGQTTPSQLAQMGATPDVVYPRDISNVRNAYLSPQLVNSNPVLGAYSVVVYNQSGGPVSYYLTSTILPINRSPVGGQGAPPTAANPAPAAKPAPAGVLNAQRRSQSGSLGPGQIATYRLDYRPPLDATGKPTPWLLSMKFSPSDAQSAPSIGFQLTDWTDPNIVGSTYGNVLEAAPATAGLTPDAPAGADVSGIKNAPVWGAAPGPFDVTVTNYAAVPASYTLTLFP